MQRARYRPPRGAQATPSVDDMVLVRRDQLRSVETLSRRFDALADRVETAITVLTLMNDLLDRAGVGA
jgi:hypothetical protein